MRRKQWAIYFLFVQKNRFLGVTKLLGRFQNVDRILCSMPLPYFIVTLDPGKINFELLFFHSKNTLNLIFLKQKFKTKANYILIPSCVPNLFLH
jgi:hypothetical protein